MNTQRVIAAVVGFLIGWGLGAAYIAVTLYQMMKRQDQSGHEDLLWYEMDNEDLDYTVGDLEDLWEWSDQQDAIENGEWGQPHLYGEPYLPPRETDDDE